MGADSPAAAAAAAAAAQPANLAKFEVAEVPPSVDNNEHAAVTAGAKGLLCSASQDTQVSSGASPRCAAGNGAGSCVAEAQAPVASLTDDPNHQRAADSAPGHGRGLPDPCNATSAAEADASASEAPAQPADGIAGTPFPDVPPAATEGVSGLGSVRTAPAALHRDSNSVRAAVIPAAVAAQSELDADGSKSEFGTLEPQGTSPVPEQGHVQELAHDIAQDPVPSAAMTAASPFHDEPATDPSAFPLSNANRGELNPQHCIPALKANDTAVAPRAAEHSKPEMNGEGDVSIPKQLQHRQRIAKKQALVKQPPSVSPAEATSPSKTVADKHMDDRILMTTELHEPVDPACVQANQRVLCPVSGRSYHFGCLSEDVQAHLCSCAAHEPQRLPDHPLQLPAPGANTAQISIKSAGDISKGHHDCKDGPANRSQAGITQNGHDSLQIHTQQQITLASSQHALECCMALPARPAADGGQTSPHLQSSTPSDRDSLAAEPWAESAAAANVGRGVAAIAARGMQICKGPERKAPSEPLRWQLICGAAVAHPEVHTCNPLPSYLPPMGCLVLCGFNAPELGPFSSTCLLLLGLVGQNSKLACSSLRVSLQWSNGSTFDKPS